MKQLTLQLDLTVESGPYLGVCQALQTTPPLVNNCYEILASTNLQPLIAVEWYLFIYHSYPTPKIILCVLVCWYLTIFTPSNAHAHPSNIIKFDFKWVARQKVIYSLFDYLLFFWSWELEIFLFCIVAHFLFLVNHPKKAVKERKAVREARKESVLELTNLITAVQDFTFIHSFKESRYWKNPGNAKDDWILTLVAMFVGAL